jgi:hypothetical protein
LKTVYTAIFGNYDDLKEPFVITPGWRYVCFTDQDLKSDVWEIIKVPVMDCGPIKTARYYKIMFYKHIKERFSLWIDATFIINTDLNEWWNRFTPPFTTIKHPFSDCAFQEAQACISLKKDTISRISDKILFYAKVGLKKNSGLIASGVLMRENTDQVQRICKKWWDQVRSGSTRDQIAFAYVDFGKGITHNIEWDYTKEHEFIHIPHLYKHSRHWKLKTLQEKYGKVQGK